MLLAEPRHAVPPSRDASRGTTRPDEIPAWFVWLSLVLVGGPSLFALAYFQHRLLADLWVGTPDAMTYSLALAVDTFGAMSGVYWFRSHLNRTLRAWGRFFAVAAVLGSTALTCWAIARLFGGPAAVAGVIPAVIVFGTTKQVTMWQADRAKNRVAERDHAAELAAAELRAVTAERAMDRMEAERDERDTRLAAQLAELERRATAAEARAERDGMSRDAADTGPIPAVERTRSAPGSRVTSIAAGASMAQRADEWIRGEWAAGREPNGKQIEAQFGAKDSFGRKRLQAMAKRGELPPSERESAAASA